MDMFARASRFSGSLYAVYRFAQESSRDLPQIISVKMLLFTQQSASQAWEIASMPVVAVT